jgi:hypothetical protein
MPTAHTHEAEKSRKRRRIELMTGLAQRFVLLRTLVAELARTAASDRVALVPTFDFTDTALVVQAEIALIIVAGVTLHVAAPKYGRG